MKTKEMKQHENRSDRICFTFTLLMALQFMVYGSPLFGQIISSDRITKWEGNVGVPGGIPHRTEICNTSACNILFSGNVTAATIQAALNSASSESVVRIPEGKWILNEAIYMVNNVTLRGAGPDKTTLAWTNSGYAHIEFKGVGNYDPPNYIASWTGGYTKGSTELLLSNTSNLSPGKLMMLDQLDDNSTLVWNGGDEGGSFTPGGNDRHLMQCVRVTAINGNQVSIDPPLYMNWDVNLSPRAWWWVNSISKAGIEDLKIDGGNHTTTYNVNFEYAYACWLKNIESSSAVKSHTYTFRAKNIEIRDSYFHHTKNYASQSYGVDFQYASACLAENNLFYSITTPMILGTGASGNVFGYNYAQNMRYDASANWLSECMCANHNPHGSMNLFEGNKGTSIYADNIHGSSSHITFLRNVATGWEPGRTSNAYPIVIDAHNRYMNLVGNILGKAGFHTTYEWYEGIKPGQPIYVLGYWNTARNDDDTYDPIVRGSLLRHGNFDYVNNSVIWDPNIVEERIPNSYYLSSKPAFFGGLDWPAIGPDITGLVQKIPAQLRYEANAMTITSPNGSEVWCKGETRDISWTATGIEGNLIIELLQNDAVVGTIASGVPASAGTFTWTVGRLENGSFFSDSHLKIRISTAAGAVVSEMEIK